MNRLLVIFGILALVGFSVGGMFVSGCNRVVRMDEASKEAWAEVDNQLKRRSDLIPNLVSTAKGYMKHEADVFKHIADARAKLAGAPAGLNPDRIKAAQGFDSALSRLLVVMENYPDLKASQQFNRLSDELAGTENRIAVARGRYNKTARAFNTFIREVFGSFYAGLRGLTEPKTYYEVSEAEKVVPKVKF